MGVHLLTLENSFLWNQKLQQLPVHQQDIHYLPEYYSIYENNGDGKAFCFIYEKNGELALYPFLINKINNLGYDLDKEYYDVQGAYGYNGVLSSSYDDDFINSFYREFNDFCLEYGIVVEFTRFNPLLQNQTFSEKHLKVIYNRDTVALDLRLPSGEIWESQYSSKNRNVIRKGEKNFKYIIEKDEKGILDFREMYIATMKKNNALDYYYFDEEYFFNLIEKLKDYTLIFSSINEKTNLKISSLILFVYKNYAHYFLSGRNLSVQDNSCTNYLLHQAIIYAKEHKCQYFHFGGGNSSAENDKLFKFKRSFSREKANFYIGSKIHNKLIYTSIVNQWNKKNKVEALKKYVLCYRY